MTTREALLTAVLAAPDDDLPRLVFADHLEENGEAERAEFIRADIATHRKQLVCARDGLKNRQKGERSPDELGRPQYWRKRCRCTSCRWARLTYRGSEHDEVNRVGAQPLPGIVASSERGFVYLIYTQVVKWCGGACQWCPDAFAPDITECRTCHDTKIVEAVGPKLVREHPITRVHVCDTFERHMLGGNLVTVINRLSLEPLFEIAFPSADDHVVGAEDELLDIISDACLKWAKSQPV